MSSRSSSTEAVAPDVRSEVLAEFASAGARPSRLRRDERAAPAGKAKEGERWFRLEFDQGGKVVSCIPVEHASDGDRTFVYVRARSPEHAHKQAWNIYVRVRKRRQHAQWVAAGLCRTCGRKPDGEGVCCKACRERSRIDTARSRARARGEDGPPPAPPRREQEAQRARLDVLREVHEVFQSAGQIDEFIDWIEDEIRKLAPPEVKGEPEPPPAELATVEAPLEPEPAPQRRVDRNTVFRPRAKEGRGNVTGRTVPPAPAWMAKPLKPPGQ